MDAFVILLRCDPNEEEQSLGARDGEQGIDLPAAERRILFQKRQQGTGVAGDKRFRRRRYGHLRVLTLEFANEIFGGGAEIGARFLRREDPGDRAETDLRVDQAVLGCEGDVAALIAAGNLPSPRGNEE